MLEVTGKIIAISPTKQISDKFSTREFAIEEYHPQYPQKVLLTLTNKNCDLINGHAIGDEVTCSINLKGREWLGHADGKPRYFNTIECWKLRQPSA